MGCTPSMLLDHKNRRRDSTGSQEAALAKIAPTPLCQNKAVQAARAPRASLESDGFSIQLSSKKDSYVSQMGNNFATQLHIKRISVINTVCVTGSHEAALAKIAPTPLCKNKAVQAARAPRASLESDGFSIQLSSKKDSYVSQMGNNFATQLHIKRISGTFTICGGQKSVCSSSGSPGPRAGRRSSLALTPEDEPLVDLANRSPPPSHVPSALLYAPPEPLELLCVFPERASRVCAAACNAAARAGGEARAVRGAREALEAFRRDADARPPHVVVVDARQPQLMDSTLLARAIRGMKNTQHIILIAVVKKSAYLKDDFAVLPYLEAGFNRVMVETLGATAWCAEMLQARTAAATARSQVGAVAALSAAADRCRDLVAVTDDQQRILLTNKSWCRVVGWRPEDGPRALTDQLSGEALRLAASGVRDWEAPVMLRRRAAPDSVLLPCRGSAVALGRQVYKLLYTSHVVFVCEPTNSVDSERARGSLHSIRRGSLDVRSVASDGLRRTSLAKLQGLPLEAPITKVLC
ncbi:high affinity cAMP-specific and IBMX-insensitive 3',5'-cyclic phosphodiesterase 8-like [Bicyclus anynana]|uniref:High affinity cAMP-specific and IBMX-insensitive 3',5'-cyclic phosphodiesterase 8-like n=1 Tax=Bicyclus anynana TaxID=110368 RepID=A0ABM3LXU3_BICAN|nr:high affinity cAMP-specific and IBMX-insensitive 3',5'-cyclic phosphodiesterase 8-like [Bicyclus anynana]